jgi:hypothetical protein
MAPACGRVRTGDVMSFMTGVSVRGTQFVRCRGTHNCDGDKAPSLTIRADYGDERRRVSFYIEQRSLRQHHINAVAVLPPG